MGKFCGRQDGRVCKGKRTRSGRATSGRLSNGGPREVRRPGEEAHAREAILERHSPHLVPVGFGPQISTVPSLSKIYLVFLSHLLLITPSPTGQSYHGNHKRAGSEGHQLVEYCRRRNYEYVSKVTTLGQPLEVMKTQMASARSQTMLQAVQTIWSRGGVMGFYQGLIPWAWIEASTKGAVLLFTASEVEKASVNAGLAPGWAGLLGGMTGGVAQAYATMGFCTCMKTAEITRHKQAASGVKPPSTWAVFMDIYRREGIAGINKGVNAVAVRQCTNWGSRMGFARLAESSIRKMRGKGEFDTLSATDKIASSAIGGALATWNQPIEVVRVEMQSMAKNPNRPANLGIFSTLSYVYKESGIKGLYRGVTPRIGLGIWQTICMVSFADYVKIWVKGK